MKFEIKLVFLIKTFLYMPKKSKQKLKCFKNEKSFQGETEIIFHHF